MKKRILFIPFELLGHYLRSIELAKELHEDFEVIFLRSDRFADFLKLHGLGMTEKRCDAYSDVVQKASNFDFSWINHDSVKRAVCEIIRIIEELKPHLVISDTYLGVDIACSFLGVRNFTLVNAYATNFYAFFRDVPHNHYSIKFKKYFSPERWEKIVRFMENLMLKRVHKPFRMIRKELGLKTKDNLFDEFTGDINFVVDDPEIFPMKNPPENFIQIGPIIYSSAQKEDVLLEFIFKNKNRPTLFISSGSSGKRIVPQIISHHKLSRYNLIVAGCDEEYFDGNAVFRKFVNFDAISEHIDLVICHGGNGTLYQSINAGKRIIAVPSNFEQEWNVQRFSSLNLCEVFYPDEDSDKLISLIEDYLEKPPNILFKSKYHGIAKIYADIIRKIILN